MTSHYDGCYDSTDASFSTQNNGRPLSYSFPWKHDLILPGQQSLPCPVCPWEDEPSFQSYLLAAHPTHSSSLAIKGRYISSSCLLYSDDLFSFSLSCQSVCWHLATFFPVALFSWFGYCFLQLLPVLPSFIRWRYKRISQFPRGTYWRSCISCDNRAGKQQEMRKGLHKGNQH